MIDTRDVLSRVKYQARVDLYRALRQGVIVRPEICEGCGAQPGRAKNGKRLIDAHHHNGYEDPLDVVWLCQHCHQLVHARRHGIKHDEDVKQRIAETLKLAYAEGRHVRPHRMGAANPFYGKTHTAEARAKISAARRSRARSS